MKIRVPNDMIVRLSKDSDISLKDKNKLELYLGSWSSPKGHGVLESGDFDISIFKKLQQILEVIDKKSNKEHYLKRQLKLLFNIISNPEGAVAKKLEDFEAVLEEYMKNTDNRIIFKKVENNFYPFLVTNIEYSPPMPYSLACVTIHIKYIEFNKTMESKIEIFKKDIIGGKNVKRVLDNLQVYLSNGILIKDYDKEFKIYNKYKDMIGEQFLGDGMGFPISGGWSSDPIQLEIEGEKSKLIVDEYVEEDYKGRTRFKNTEGVETIFDVNGKDYRVPIHLNLFCFNLNSHEYVKVHINNVEVYEYNPELIKKLVIPKENKELIDILIDGTTDIMEDIVKGKTGGIIVFTTGPPGTGKTLTAEVYSEVVKKPLYIIQSSQLGISVEELEKNLKKILSRASRWNAILLIDEADVYVHERGDDLTQNAVVGVFLRVLEYYKGILFMTSNRERIIDDAILSRTTAHIRYDIPDEESSKKIWSVLADQFEVKISSEEIDKIYSEFGRIPGRDIKSLIKLARLLGKRKKIPVDCELLKHVSKFLDVFVLEDEQ